MCGGGGVSVGRGRGHGEVGGKRGEGIVTFGSGEMNDIAIFLEHVDLLDGLDGLNVEFLKRGLEFFVVGAGGLVDFLLLSSRCAFASMVGWIVSAFRSRDSSRSVESDCSRCVGRFGKPFWARGATSWKLYDEGELTLGYSVSEVQKILSLEILRPWKLTNSHGLLELG